MRKDKPPGNITDMSETEAERKGLVDRKGYLTDKGKDQATSKDWDRYIRAAAEWEKQHVVISSELDPNHRR